jgi:glycerophosphoryl diester phosphodiesterase
VISGNRPFKSISDDATRRVGIDGRLSDLDSSMPAHLMPLISDRWGAHFQWNGVGTFPADQREKLHEIVRRAHAAGRRVRFWATPETPAMWSELVEAGVDHVNTDQLDQLRDFLLTRH